MIYVSQHKNYQFSSHVVVIYAQQCRPQIKPLVQNVFVTWSGKNIASGSISRQLCSVWQKMGI